MIEKIGPTIHNSESIYNTGAGGGGGGGGVDYENGAIEKIGDFYYKVKKIQNRIWLCENFVQNIGTSYYRYGTRYYNGTETNFTTIKNYLLGLGNGWRIPTYTDATDLLTITNKQSLYDITWNITGLNPIGMDFKKMGDRDNSSFNGVGTRGNFWLDTMFNATSRYSLYCYNNTGPETNSSSDYYNYNLRLCKDV